MKNIILPFKNSVLTLVGCLFVMGACSDSGNNRGNEEGELTAVEGVRLSLGNIGSSLEATTRVVSGFVVNTADDPTYSLDDKLAWSLDLTIYKGNSPYAEGHGIFTWNAPSLMWTASGQDIYMPNYFMQEVVGTLYPDSWESGNKTIVTDQRNLTVFIEQDILEQNSDTRYVTAPAHHLEVEMRHSHSMIDFVLADVDPGDIASVNVIADGDTYEPYKVPGQDREEYLVILPTGVEYPVIRVQTNAGAIYSKELDIEETLVNTCYYVRLVGIELILDGLAVSNWTHGEAAAGDYSSVTSYPTFRGPSELTVTVYYESGTSQQMTFNEKGDAVVRPAGRTIVAVENGSGRYNLPVPYTIRTQIIDLNPYISLIGT